MKPEEVRGTKSWINRLVVVSAPSISPQIAAVVTTDACFVYLKDLRNLGFRTTWRDVKMVPVAQFLQPNYNTHPNSIDVPEILRNNPAWQQEAFLLLETMRTKWSRKPRR